MKLNNVIALKEIQENMNTNLIGDEDLFSSIITGISLFNMEDNKIILDLKNFGLDNTLEMALYKGEETGQFLLESRIFNNKDDSMINAYLEVLNNDLSIHNEYIDDVWSYDDWSLI